MGHSPLEIFAGIRLGTLVAWTLAGPGS
jgi:acid phosphatase family membrane protein YuiD